MQGFKCHQALEPMAPGSRVKIQDLQEDKINISVEFRFFLICSLGPFFWPPGKNIRKHPSFLINGPSTQKTGKARESAIPKRIHTNPILLLNALRMLDEANWAFTSPVSPLACLVVELLQAQSLHLHVSWQKVLVGSGKDHEGHMNWLALSHCCVKIAQEVCVKV